jgi:hypothetical protein
VARPRLPAADFRFPQDEDHDVISEVARHSAAKSGLGVLVVAFGVGLLKH